MMIITPDYDLLLNIVLVIWAMKAFINIIVGAAGIEIPKRDRFNGAEVCSGIVMLLLVIWVIL